MRKLKELNSLCICLQIYSFLIRREEVSCTWWLQAQILKLTIAFQRLSSVAYL